MSWILSPWSTTTTRSLSTGIAHALRSSDMVTVCGGAQEKGAKNNSRVSVLAHGHVA